MNDTDAEKTGFEPTVFGAEKGNVENYIQPVTSTEELRAPTDDERKHLRTVADTLPWSAYALCIFVCIQWGANSGASAVFWNFVQFPLPKGGSGTGATPAGTQETPGALGWGLRTTNAIFTSIEFLSPFFNIFAAWLADTKFGRYRVLLVATWVSCTYSVLLIISGVPSILRAGHSGAPFTMGFCLNILATSMYGPVVAPVILDQYTQPHDYVRPLESGELVIIGRHATLSRLEWLFYGIGNIGPFLAIGTTWAEKKVGYWLTFTVAGSITFLLPTILFLIRRYMVQVAPNSKDFVQTFSVIWVTFRKRKLGTFFQSNAWEAAKPSKLAAQGVTTFRHKPISWSDEFVDNVGKNAAAYQIFFFFIIYNLTGGGIGVVSSSQASTLTTNGAPNDLLGSINPLATVFFMPILAYGVFPLLRKCKIRCGRITRMTIGFLLGSLASFYGAVLQWRIYETSPCGYHATGCEIGSGVTSISVWVQSPVYIINALSQLLTWVAAYEVAYIHAPKNMKAVTLAVLQFVSIFSNAISAACAPAITDPNLIWVWAAPGFANLISTAFFYWKYRHHDDEKAEG